MLALVALAVGFGAIVASSPTKLAIAILYLSGRVTPVARAVAFTLGNTAVLSTVAWLGWMGASTFVVASEDRPTVGDWLDVAIGSLLLAVGAYGLARPGSVGPAALGVGNSDLRPRLGRALAFGASYAVVAFGRLLVIAAGSSWIARMPGSPAFQAAMVLLMLVVAQFPLWFPIVVHVVAPDRIERIQGLTDRSIQQIGGRTGAVIVLVVGGLLTLSGLSWLV